MDCCIDNLLVTEVSVPIPEIICFSKGSPKGISCASKDSIGFPKEIFGSPRGVICVSKDSIGFRKEIFVSPKGVSQIRIRVRQIMYVDQIEVFRCPNRSIMAAQRSQTSRFSVGFSGGNSEQTVKQLREVFSRKHCAHCLKAVPGYWCKIAKHCKQILSPVIANCSIYDSSHTAPHGKKTTSLERFTR